MQFYFVDKQKSGQPKVNSSYATSCWMAVCPWWMDTRYGIITELQPGCDDGPLHWLLWAPNNIRDAQEMRNWLNWFLAKSNNCLLAVDRLQPRRSLDASLHWMGTRTTTQVRYRGSAVTGRNHQAREGCVVGWDCKSLAGSRRVYRLYLGIHLARLWVWTH